MIVKKIDQPKKEMFIEESNKFAAAITKENISF
jgi:hypothetical protein